MLVDHLFQRGISLWPRTAKKRGFCSGVTDVWTDERTKRWPFKRFKSILSAQSFKSNLSFKPFRSFETFESF